MTKKHHHAQKSKPLQTVINCVHGLCMAKRQITFLITAGPTVEDLDPVRFLSNRSSGKMGYALAQAALRARHKVVLISGPTALSQPKGVKFIPVRSARDMLAATLKEAPHADIIIKSAAVADYRPYKTKSRKIKKNAATLILTLIKNPDILKILGQRKKNTQVLVGFAAETHTVLYYAKKKLSEKNTDWLVINDVSRKDIGFDAEKNEVQLLAKDGRQLGFAKQSKLSLAKELIALFANEWSKKSEKQSKP